jgi:hypothetical protein
MSNEDTYIFYPDKDLIEMWLVLLKSENIELKLKLLKEDWMRKIEREIKYNTEKMPN